MRKGKSKYPFSDTYNGNPREYSRLWIQHKRKKMRVIRLDKLADPTAKAIWNELRGKNGWPDKPWQHLNASNREHYRVVARAALEVLK